MIDFSSIAAIIRPLPKNKWLGAGAAIVILLIPAMYFEFAKLDRGEAAVSFPFASKKIRGVTIGIDPARVQLSRGGDASTCSLRAVDLSDRKIYGYEVNMWTLNPEGNEGTFDSDQTPGAIWRVEGTSSANAISVGFKHGDDASGSGTISLIKDPNLPYATGWQVATDCVGKVVTVCPYVAAPVDGVTIDTLRNAPHLRNTCRLLDDSENVHVTDRK